MLQKVKNKLMRYSVIGKFIHIVPHKESADFFLEYYTITELGDVLGYYTIDEINEVFNEPWHCIYRLHSIHNSTFKGFIIIHIDDIQKKNFSIHGAGYGESFGSIRAYSEAIFLIPYFLEKIIKVKQINSCCKKTNHKAIQILEKSCFIKNDLLINKNKVYFQLDKDKFRANSFLKYYDKCKIVVKNISTNKSYNYSNIS